MINYIILIGVISACLGWIIGYISYLLEERDKNE